MIEAIQRESRVIIAGPTTLWSILNSLQMGFRTLAIQKRSSEVWNLLAAVKTEWTKYGDVLEAVQKKLHQASDTIGKAQVRSRAIGRQLKDVQELPAGAATALLNVTPVDDDIEASDVDETEDDLKSSAAVSSTELIIMVGALYMTKAGAWPARLNIGQSRCGSHWVTYAALGSSTRSS